jgi:hypothetical protein
MRTILRMAFGVLALCLWQPPVAAETVQGTARVASRTIALPPGTWTKVAEELAPRGWQFGGPPQNLMNLSTAYVRTSAGRVTGLVTVILSRDGSAAGNGYTPERNCSRNDFFYSAVRSNYPIDQDCLFVSHTLLVMPQNRESFQGTYLTAARAAGTVPPTWISAYTRKSDGMHLLIVSYFFAPEAAGFPSSQSNWDSSPWHKANLDAPRRAYMERVKTWAELAQEQTRLSFRNRPVTPLPEP